MNTFQANSSRGGLPPDFEQRSPDYQRAWLSRRIPELQKEIEEEESVVAGDKERLAEKRRLQQSFQVERLALIKKNREALKRGLPVTDASILKRPKGASWIGMLGDVLGSSFRSSALAIKRQVLRDLEARLESLEASSSEDQRSIRQAEAKLERHEENQTQALQRILQGRQFEDLPADEQDDYKEEENSWAEILRNDREELRSLQR